MTRRFPSVCICVHLWPLILLTSCGPKQAAEVKTTAAPIAVTTAPAVIRQVPADFEETGTFIAEESSQIAPVAPGRVISTPVDVGAHVGKGDIVCELDPRDAQLRLDQTRAQLAEATANVRQMQSRIGLSSAQGGTFDPDKVPEVAAARANYESALANARMATADAQRYANLAVTGDVSQSALQRARTQQETAEAQVNAAKQQYEAAANAARQSSEMISTSLATLDSVKAQVAQAEKSLADTKIRAPFDGFITARPVRPANTLRWRTRSQPSSASAPSSSIFRRRSNGRLSRTSATRSSRELLRSRTANSRAA